MLLFPTVTKERICSEIEVAERHVILAAPGIGMPVGRRTVGNLATTAKRRCAGRSGHLVKHCALEILRARGGRKTRGGWYFPASA